MDWTRILTNVAGEVFAPATAAYVLAAIGLNMHFGMTGLINMGQAGFMLMGAYGFAIATMNGWPVWAAVLAGLDGGGALRGAARHPDPVAARRLPRDRHDRRRRDRAARRCDRRR